MVHGHFPFKGRKSADPEPKREKKGRGKEEEETKYILLEEEIKEARFQVDEDVSELCTDLIGRILVK